MRCGRSTRPAPAPSVRKSFLIRGATTPEASRIPTTDASTSPERSAGHIRGDPNRVGRVPAGDKGHRIKRTY
ncbi:hypothetical protein GCM10010215_07380 [Streptomyces virginiae]|uniref:Uncharacterized protein n=1 Tax=Streptomyces virginiae TaxID=1961 RepID=A0ABQ3NT52_STRVG|nr:hypothetical protein GCM10010215_07380 [Streptomyces virginiae]GHI15919.1 hypothetical protein Scinn_53820 [Streptomyces virginiae]